MRPPTSLWKTSTRESFDDLSNLTLDGSFHIRRPSKFDIQRLLDILHGFNHDGVTLARLHLFGRNISDMCLKPPYVAEWIAHASHPISPKEIGRLRHLACATRQSLCMDAVYFAHVQPQEGWRRAPRCMRVEEHDD